MNDGEADDASLSDVDADLDDLVPPSDDLGAFHRDVLVGLAGGVAADLLAFGAAARAACAGAPAGVAVCAAHASAFRHLLGEADVAGSGLSDVAAVCDWVLLLMPCTPSPSRVYPT